MLLAIIPIAEWNINIFSKKQKNLKKVLAFLEKVCYSIKAPEIGVVCDY